MEKSPPLLGQMVLRNKRHLIIGVVSLLMCCVQQLNGQRIHKITTSDGLSQNFVGALMEGKDGFMWIGTQNGLDRYDGKNFVTYRYNPNDPYSIASDRIAKLFKDKEQNMWVKTKEKLQMYDIETGKFLTPAYCNDHPLVTNRMLFFDENNILWYCDWNEISSFKLTINRQGKEVLPILELVQKYRVPVEEFGNITTIAKRDSVLIFGSNNGSLYSLMPGSGQIDLLASKVLDEKIGGIWIDPQGGGIWAQGQKKSALYASGKIRYFDGTILGFNDGTQGAIFNRESYMISNQQVFVWDGESLKPTALMIPEEIYTAAFDHQGNLWLGTNAQGIRYIELTKAEFGIGDNDVCNIHPVQIDHNGTVWYFEKTPNSREWGCYREMLRPSGLPGRVMTNTICKRALREDSNGRFWMQFELGKLGFVEKPGGKVTYVSPIDPPLPLPTKNNEEDVLYFVDEYIFYKYHIPTGRYQQINLGMLGVYPPGPYKNDHCTDVVKDMKGRLWVGISTGLVGFEWIGTALKNYFWDGKVNGVSVIKDMGVLGLSPDPQNQDILWLATPGGLVCWNAETKEATLINNKNGLPDDLIFSVVAGDSGELWLGTSKGLVEYRPITGICRIFTEQDGLPAAEFNRNSAVQSPIDHTLYMNTTSGIIWFQPADFKLDSTPAPLVFTGLTVNGAPVQIGTGGINIQEFPHDKNSLTIDFALLDFVKPEESRYEYRMGDTTNNWIQLGNKNNVAFLNLAPGDYQLWIRGRRSDGKISEPIKYEFTIFPPWWQTWYAYAAYFLAFVALLWGIASTWVYTERMKNQLQTNELIKQHRENTERARSRLLTNITHEIRTPLTVILGITEHLISKLSGDNREKAKILHRGGEELLQLSNQVLDLAKGKELSDDVNAQYRNLSLLIRQIADSFLLIAELRNIHFHFHQSTEIWSWYDEYAVKSIVTNLLNNAFKFTREGGTVELSLSHEKDDWIQIEIKDTGIGMSQEVSELIFNRFYQAESPQKKVGSGIGLAYVKEIVEASGGRIMVKSKEGEGSLFTVMLPWISVPDIPETPSKFLSDASGSSKQEHDLHVSEAPKPVILVVEDNPVMAEYVFHCLQDKYQVKEARNSESAMATAFEILPDIIISDVMIPGETGFELCKRWKDDVRTSHIPVILLTAKSDQSDVNQGLEAGADAYLFKPFDQQELMLRLENLLRQQQRIQQYYAENRQDAAVKAPQTGYSQRDEMFLHQFDELLKAQFSNNDFEIKDMERALSMSQTQLQRKITALTGVTPGRLLSEYRLTKAKELLDASQGLNITEIAYACGFNSASYFSTAFRQKFGVSPKNYKAGTI